MKAYRQRFIFEMTLANWPCVQFQAQGSVETKKKREMCRSSQVNPVETTKNTPMPLVYV